MSLLLQALQKAAKNRESSAPAPATEVPASPPSQPEPVELTPSPSFSLESAPAEEMPRGPELAIEEEDIFEPEELAAAPLLEPQAERFEPFASSAPESARAASILRATEAPTSGRLDWIRDHPVHTFAAVAGVFMVFYGAYVYLQLFHPALLRGDFLSKPFAAQTPPPPAQPIKPVPAPVAEATPPAPAPASQTLPGPTPAAGSPAAGAPAVPPPNAPMAGMPAAVSKPASAEPVTAAPTAPVQPSTAPTVAQASPRAPGAGGRPRAQLRASAAASSASVEDNLARKEPEPNGAPVSPTMTQAYEALQSGNLDRAEALYREVIQSDAQNIDAMLGLATIAAQRGNSQQAIGFYERALELEPRNSVAQAGLIAIIGQADPQTSETRLKQLIAREPSAFLYFNLGNLYARQDQWASAQAAYFQAYQMQPDSPDYAYNLAIGLEHLNQPKLALTYYRKAVELSFQKGRANFDQKRVIERIGQLSARVD